MTERRDSEYAVNCLNCVHFDPMTLMTCAAFPEGIPVSVLAGDTQHDTEIEGDGGIRFQAIAGAVKLDAKGVECGKSYIPASKECRVGKSKAERKSASSAGNKPSRSGSEAEKVVAGAAGIATGLAVAAGAVAVSRRLSVDPTTPQQNQSYSDKFPSDKEFAEAKIEPVNPAVSFEKGGIHKFGKVKAGGKQFFVKKAPEVGIAKEIAAYDTAKAIGLDDYVLPVRRVYFDEKSYVASPLLKQEDLRRLGTTKELSKIVKSLPRELTGSFFALDYTLNNFDRHAGNILVRKNGKPLLIDHGGMLWDIPSVQFQAIEKSFLFNHAFNKNREARLPTSSVKRVVEKRAEIRKAFVSRYAGQPRRVVDPIIKNLDRRFEVMESMVETGDTRIKHMIDGRVVKSRGDSTGVEIGRGYIRRGSEIYRFDADGVSASPLKPEEYDSYIVGSFLGDLAPYLTRENAIEIVRSKLQELAKEEQ